MTDTVTTRRTRSRRIGNLAWRAIKIEARGYQSMFRLVFRRPRVPAGGVGFGYHANVLMVLIVLTVISALELVVVDLIVRQWPYIRIPLFVLGVWGVIYMLGMLCGMLTRPHAIATGGLRVRDGTEVDIALAWNDIDAVVRRKVSLQEKRPKLTVDDGVRTFWLRVQNETNIEVELERPLSVRLPHGIETVDKIAFYVDDPDAYMRHMLTYA